MSANPPALKTKPQSGSLTYLSTSAGSRESQSKSVRVGLKAALY